MKKTTTNVWGTCHFESHLAAVLYYRPYEGKNAERAVERKLAAHEIKIGKPELEPGQKMFLHKGEGRYFIEETK